MSEGSSKALKAKVVTREVDEEEELSHDDEPTELKPDEYDGVLHDYMALKHHVFWKNPAKAKDYVRKHSPSSYTKGGTQKLRSCFNCDSNLHFIAECTYEPREKHAGRLVHKDKTKSPSKKPLFNKNFPQRKFPQELCWWPKKNTCPTMMKKKKIP